MALVSSNSKLNTVLWTFLKFSISKRCKALGSWFKKDMGWNFSQSMKSLPCHKWGKFKEIKERRSVFILMILSKIALVFFTTLDYKFHQKFKNDSNDVKFWMNIVKLVIFHSEQKGLHYEWSSLKCTSPKCVAQ